MNINKILLDLAADSSRIAKENILNANKDNNLLQRVFLMALDPYVNYYIKNIPTFQQVNVTMDLATALHELSSLSQRKVTGNAAIDHLSTILSSLSTDDAEVVIKIIRRDLRCGVSTATVNKVWKDWIPTYPCLLCSPYDEKLIKRINFINGAIVQQKEDGLRFNAIVNDGVCNFYSRKGSPIELADDSLATEFINLAAGKNLVFDGELLAYRNGILLPRKEGNGIANKAIKGTITKEESRLLCGVLWDVIPFESFKAGKCSIRYEDRFNTLNALLMDVYGDDGVVTDILKYGQQKIKIVPSFEVFSFDDAQDIFQKYLSEGLEGVIIKDKSSPWEDARSKYQIKLKAEKVCELRVVGWNYGAVGTKNEHRLGSLLCESEDGLVQVNISGFSDKERDEITEAESVGKIVSVMYNERITKKTGGVDSLFLPRIVEFREDKDIADFSKDIK